MVAQLVEELRYKPDVRGFDFWGSISGVRFLMVSLEFLIFPATLYPLV
jgi:hypothetical protein